MATHPLYTPPVSDTSLIPQLRIPAKSINFTAKIQGTGGWKDGFEKAQSFLDELTLEEKVGMVTGVNGPCIGNTAPIPRLGWPGLCLQDGPMGISCLSVVYPRARELINLTSVETIDP